jgi:hypothetical protein
MHFRVACVVDDLSGKMCDEAIAYDLAQPFVSRISIYLEKTAVDLPKGSSVFASCTASLELGESEGLDDLTAAIARSKDGRHANFEGMNEKMRAIYDIVDPIFRQLKINLEASVMLLKWRCGITEGSIKSLSNRSEAVSINGAEWRGISTLRGIKVVFSKPSRKIDSTVFQEVGRLHNEGAETSLGLQLIIEALNQKITHPRSALVIAVTAAEIALKQLIGELAPEARWLAENVPSPPIVRIARDYVPSLKVRAHFRGKTLRLPKRLLRKLAEAVEMRNKVVHAGELPPGEEALKEILAAAEDIVWICDLYAGHLWAGEHVSRETTSAWEDEN